MRGYDAYITGGNHHHSTEDLGCETCGHTWEAEVEVEYGGIVSEHTCPQCSSEQWTTAISLKPRFEDEG